MYNKFIDKIIIILNTLLWLGDLNYANLNSLYVLNDFRLASHASIVYQLDVLRASWFTLTYADLSSVFCASIKVF